MANKMQATVTLNIESWKIVMDLVKLSCQPRGENWINWGQAINKIIQSAIDKSFRESGVEDNTDRLDGIISADYKRYTYSVEVHFKGGAIYEYHLVPYEIYVHLMRAESREEYFYKMIHDKYQRKRVSPEVNQKKHHFENDESDFDQNHDEYDTHNPDFGRWVDVGGGEDVWDSYTDDD